MLTTEPMTKHSRRAYCSEVLPEQVRSYNVEKKWLDKATKIILPPNKSSAISDIEITKGEVQKYAVYEKIYALVKYHISKEMFKGSGYSFSTIKRLHAEMYNYLYRPDGMHNTLDKKVVDNIVSQGLLPLALPNDVVYERTAKKIRKLRVSQAPRDKNISFTYIFSSISVPKLLAYKVVEVEKVANEKSKTTGIVRKLDKPAALDFLFSNINKLSKDEILSSSLFSVIAKTTANAYYCVAKRLLDGKSVTSPAYTWIANYYEKSVLGTIKNKQETSKVSVKTSETNQNVEVRAEEPITDKETMFGLMFEQEGKQHVMDVCSHSREFVEGVKSVYDNTGKDYKVRIVKIEVLQ